MARQKGIFKLKGRIGDVSFFKTRRGYQAREASGVDAQRIATDPAFLRTRENGAEFAGIARAGKLLKDTARPLLMGVSHTNIIPRMMKVMAAVKNLDVTSPRGERNVGVGITNPAGKAMLKGFNFNSKARLEAVLFKAFALNTSTGDVSFSGLLPINEVVAPAGATHVTFRSAWGRVDFATGDKEIHESNAVTLPLNGALANFTLTPATKPSGTGNDFYFLKIEFFQEVSGVQYSLKNGVYNALTIIELI